MDAHYYMLPVCLCVWYNVLAYLSKTCLPLTTFLYLK